MKAITNIARNFALDSQITAAPHLQGELSVGLMKIQTQRASEASEPRLIRVVVETGLRKPIEILNATKNCTEKQPSSHSRFRPFLHGGLTDNQQLGFGSQ